VECLQPDLYAGVTRLQRYGPNGACQGAVSTGAVAAAGYVALALVAWELANPFTTWWAAHPQYHRDNAAA